MTINNPKEKYIGEILNYLPHRYPFLLIDRVTNLVSGESITGFKNVTINEDMFNGHFPNQPIMPGVLIIEAAAQLSGILALKPKAPGLPTAKIICLEGLRKPVLKDL